MNQIIYTVWQEPEGWVAKCLVTGVVSCGDTAEEAIKMLQEAVEMYLEGEPEANVPRKNIRFGNLALNA